MSSIDNKEHGELEQSMWRRFQDAKAMPDPEVWSRIDHELTLLENAKYKKRVLFYRQLAAACFILFILAGSALVLHFKYDEEKALLATTAQQRNSATIANANNFENTESENAASTITESDAKTYTSTEKTATAAATQTQTITEQYAYAENTVSRDKQSASIDQRSSNNNTVSRDIVGSNVIEQADNTAELIALTTDAKGTGSVAALVEQKSTGFVPAGQAIANVPANYTSPATINPLLRKNALLGTTSPENETPETIALQKQAEVVLALNTPATDDKEDKSATGSRWNVGMAYGSTYFNQNIAIPGYTITPRMNGFGVVPDPRIKLDPGPSISEESELNMRDARIEFEENTQAASSFNLDAKAGFRIGKRLKLLAGLGYSQNTSKTKTSYIVEQFLFKPRTNERYKLQPTTVFLPSLNTFTTDSISVVKTKPFDVDYSYQMLSVPLGLQVEGNVGPKWFWYAAGGMAANFLMQTTIRSSNPEIASVTYSATDDSPFRKVQFSGNMGLGIGKRISNNVNVSIGPEFRTFFNSMLTDEKAVATQGRPYTIGLNMGVNYTLGATN